MRGFASTHPQYTLHDEVHLLRVTELMARVLGSDGLAMLNPVEIALLILAAHFHDQGMVLEPSDIAGLANDHRYNLFRQTWSIEHPNLMEVQTELNEPNKTNAESLALRKTESELLAALHTDYIRTTHGERSAAFILSRYGDDKRLNFSDLNISPLVAKLSLSHVRPASELNEAKGFNYDEAVGAYTVNMVYLGIILRLADILDFDRDRTPDSLYRSIYFTSPISLQEWEKHRGVTGWTINQNMIRFTAYFENPEYERAARQFMDWIDTELAACHNVISRFPHPIEKYKLNLPVLVDRDRIKPKEGAYIYHNLEFTLSRDEIVKLLMTEKLYGSAALCIRELLQNSLDAIRLRKAMIARDTTASWEGGEVIFEHFLNENKYEIVRCFDNGAGMDEHIITKFLTNAGRSYYKSPEFEQERYSLKQANVDFEPIGQFGIGFMSCFMLGDKVIIRTRKDYGKGIGYGPSLQVEINGLGGIIIIKELDYDLPIGTTIDIYCAKFKGALNYFIPKAQVVNTLLAITIASEFPIKASCTIPRNENKCFINPGIIDIVTPEQKAGLHDIITISHNFTDSSPLLQGKLSISFLTNQGKIVTRNDEAVLEPAKAQHGNGNDIHPNFLVLNNKHNIHRGEASRISFDGIYVCGHLWHNGIEPDLRSHVIGLTSYANPANDRAATFTMNVRGNLKAPLTPSRAPDAPHSYYRKKAYLPNGWNRLALYVDLGICSIYEKLISQLFGPVDPIDYWKYIAYNGVDFDSFNMMTMWNSIALPFANQEQEVIWIPMKELRELVVGERDFGSFLIDVQSQRKCSWADSWRWTGPNYSSFPNSINNFLLSFCDLDFQQGKYSLTILKPQNSIEVVGNRHISDSFRGFRAIPYTGSLSGCLTSLMFLHTVNASHELTKLAIHAIKSSYKSAMDNFAIEMLLLSTYNYRDPEHFMADIGKRSVWTKRLGMMHELIDWAEQKDDVKPPYKLHFINGEFLQLTGDMFKTWSKYDVDDVDDVDY